MRRCAVKDCSRSYESSGYCSLHRSRFRQFGDPLKTGVKPHGHVYDRARTKFTVGAADECWLWEASRSHDGYGVIAPGGANPPRLLYAHRVVFEMYGNVIPEGYQVDHLCQNPSCVNPAHLEAVTKSENLRRAGVVSAAQAAARRALLPPSPGQTRDLITGRFVRKPQVG